jgi:hypothetical protein
MLGVTPVARMKCRQAVGEPPRFPGRRRAAAGVPAAAVVLGGPLAAGTADAAEPGVAPGQFAPIPPSALGPPLNSQGYHVGRIAGNLYWVTDSAYTAMFLTTRDGVVLVDAPATIGHNLLRAIDQVTQATADRARSPT